MNQSDISNEDNQSSELSSTEIKQHLHDYVLYNILLGIFSCILLIISWLWCSHSFFNSIISPNKLSYKTQIVKSSKKIKYGTPVGQFIFRKTSPQKIKTYIQPLGMILANPGDSVEIAPNYIKINNKSILKNKNLNYLLMFKKSLNLNIDDNTKSFKTIMQDQTNPKKRLIPTYLLIRNINHPTFSIANTYKVNVIIEKLYHHDLSWVNYFRGTEKLRQ